MNSYKITTGDFLAGGGGVTRAMSLIPNVQVKWVLNHDKIAIRTNMFNNSGIKHYWADIYKQDEHEMEPVDFVWASIECTQHSKANGGRDKKIGSYTLGWELVRYIKFLNPLVIGIENVPEFKDWAPLNKYGKPNKNRKGFEFERWKKTIKAFGYEYSEFICNAADFGIPTRRVRYFAFFHRIELGLDINWPAPTHHKTGANGLKKWVSCRNYINLTNEGQSIFGREFNPEIAKGKRKPLSENTLKRIAGGVKRYAPEMRFIFQYYGNGLNVQSLDNPLNTIPTKDRHVLVKLEKLHFVADHIHSDNFNTMDEPLNPILTRQTKQLITLEKMQFITKYYKGNHNQDINAPYPTITTIDHNALVTAKMQFISTQYNSNGSPEANNRDLEQPLSTVTTANKQQLITAIQNGLIDFDIKMRFLDPEELALISTFPSGYFTNKQLKLNKKEQTKLIGNAVPPEWAKIIIEPVVNELSNILNAKREAI